MRKARFLRACGIPWLSEHLIVDAEDLELGAAVYLVGGFLIGLAVAALASYGLYQAMALSYSTYEFSLPWLQVGVSVAVVLVVILVSVVYALRRAGSSNLVEALRADAL